MTIVAEDNKLRIDKLETSLFRTNTYIIGCKDTEESVLIDAPGEASKITKSLKNSNPKYILVTHNHMDHIGALKELQVNLRIPVAAHSDDSSRLPVSPDIFLNNGDKISFGNVNLKVLHTPGHTPGSVCFLADEYLIAGDTIFPGGPGKTSTPDDLKQILESLKEKIFVLPDNTKIFPGHGNSTVLKKEKKEFDVFSSRPHSPNLCGDVLWLSS